MEIELDAKVHRTFGFWHVFVAGARAGWLYTWRADGPNEPAAGLRFDASRELLDPWARLVSDSCWDRAGRARRRRRRSALRAEIAPADDYDWEGDRPLRRPLQDAVIYELHVGGFTKHPSSGVAQPGTFRGLVDKIPYLQALGITDVELLPVFAFDTQDVPAPTGGPRARQLLGLQPRELFRAASRVRRRRRPAARVSRHGEGAARGRHRRDPRRGAESHGRGRRRRADDRLQGARQRAFLSARSRRIARSISTSRAAATPSARISRSSRSGWSSACGSGPSRCTSTASASILRRCCRATSRGKPLAHAPVIAAIEFAPELADVHLIAEAWDAGGLYQVGSFPGSRWAEWNGRYRDAVRRFLRAEPGRLGELATRMAGSSDLYAWAWKTPQNSINFVTCHDGFTLYDAVSYDRKHNSGNGEHNRDGRDENLSWNSGVEGATDDPDVLRLRGQRARNFMAVLHAEPGRADADGRRRGVADAARQQQRVLPGQRRELARLVVRARRAGDAALHARAHRAAQTASELAPHALLDGDGQATSAEIQWYGETLEPPAWADPEARVLCFTLTGVDAAGAGAARHDQHGVDGAHAAVAAARPSATGAGSRIRRSSRPTTSCRRASRCRAAITASGRTASPSSRTIASW